MNLAGFLQQQLRASFFEANVTPSSDLLAAQAATLKAMFTNLVDRAFKSESFEAFDRFMRYGLRAQAQSRATLETLAAIKNPPMVFARQANIANGSQQVNNTAQLFEGSRVRPFPTYRRPNFGGSCRTGVDPGTAQAAIGGDSTVEAVGVVNWAEKRRR